MPTAAKLIAAIAYAAVAYFASDAVIAQLPEGIDVGNFTYVNTVIGALVGWFVMGRLAGEGYGVAVTMGLRTTAVFVFYALLTHAILEMLDRAMRMRYSDTMEALQGMMEIMGEYGLTVATAPPVVAILLVGGTIAAFFVEWTAQRWD